MLLGSWLLNVCQLYPFWACLGLDWGSSRVTVTTIYVAKLGCSLSLSLLLDPPTPHLLNSLWPKSCDVTLQSTLLFLAWQPDRFAGWRAARGGGLSFITTFQLMNHTTGVPSCMVGTGFAFCRKPRKSPGLRRTLPGHPLS